MQKSLCSIIAISSLCATEPQSFLEDCSLDTSVRYVYSKLSDQWGICPGLGLGYRYHDRWGFDVDVAAYTYWESGYGYYGKSHCLLYPDKKHFYIGIGAGFIGGRFLTPWDRYGYFVKPTMECLLGYEWKVRKQPLFVQLEWGFSRGEIRDYPVLSFGAGF